MAAIGKQYKAEQSVNRSYPRSSALCLFCWKTLSTPFL